MNRSVGLVVLAVSFLSLAFALLRPSLAAETKQPIRVAQFIAAHPIGFLGYPLGERVVIEGTLSEQGMLVNALAITRADGHVLPEVANIELTGDKAPKIEKNINYKLEGYESGGFSGSPGWLAAEAQQPFQYHSTFVVTRVIEPAAK